MSQALYRKWRPRLWDQVIGQEHVVQTLRNAVVADRVAHAYLFAGPRGTGKTTTARLLAKAVNCLEENLASRPCDQCENCQAVNQGRFLDLIEIDAASNTSVEDIRDLRDKISFSPNRGRFKVYIIDEVHMLSTAAFNALLKTLEEPPPHAMGSMATTEIHKIPATVLSRCQRHEFRRIPVNEIVAHLHQMAEAEGLDVELDALTLLARQSTGAMRDAISLLDQLASSGQKITLEMAQTVLGTAASQSVLAIVDCVLEQNAAAGLEQVHIALDSGSDPRQFARQIVDYLRSLLLVKMGSADQVEASAETRAIMARHAQAMEIPEMLRVIRVFTQAANESRSAWQPALPLEMAFIEALDEPARDLAGEPPAAAPSHPKTPRKRTSARPEPPPVQEPAAVDAPAGALDQAGISLQYIQQQWRQILTLVKRSNQETGALLNSGQLLGIKNGALFFGLSEVLKAKMEKDDNIKLVEQALSDVLKTEMQFRCIVSTGKSGKLPPDVDSDGMIAAALRDLGGEIVDIQ